jgi:2-hydroxy-3-keto-5-methylthiopentenyl-1-phosphate phosphatase
MTAVHWTLICDFDGTIAQQDVTDVLLERFASVEWKLVERSWQAGRLSSRECLQRQVELLRVTRVQINAMLPQITLDPAFAAFVAMAQAAGCEIHVASEGFDQVIRALLARAQVPSLPIAATYLVSAGHDTWLLGFPFAQPDCRTDAATCKCAVADAAARANRRVLLIGDGLSDCCVASRADVVFARGRLLEYCREREINHEAVANFTTALHRLGALLGTPLQPVEPVVEESAHG